ncbi:MCPT9 protease, partial [Rostratula benghalensis]|nr:MCPT9 protease [Rostratula benghalensis]
YVVYLQGRNKEFCGGFFVAPNWVMTAAQCFKHKPLTVVLETHTIQKKEETWQKFQVQEYHLHPNFRNPKEGNDILLLKLKGNATSNNVRTISFEKAKVPGETMCSIAGWVHKATTTCRKADVTIIKQRDCLSHNPGLADNLICGYSRSSGIPEEVSLTSGIEGCGGGFNLSDAGAPLICNNKAYGIFSYRQKNWPAFYTHIAPYLPWVNTVMK